MEIITGVAPAEYGDKSSLVVHIVTKSGLDQPKPTGSAVGRATARSRARRARSTSAAGSHTVGNFLSVSGMRTDRFLDPPEFAGAARHGQQPVVLQPARLPSERRRHAAPERAGRRGRRSTCRTRYDQTRRPGAASEHHHVQRRARLFAGHRLEDAVHGQRVRPPGSPDLPAERRIRSPTSPARVSQDRTLTNIGRQGRRRVHDRQPQREDRRHASARRSCTRTSRSASPIRRDPAVSPDARTARLQIPALRAATT